MAKQNMPKHAFKFPRPVVDAVKSHVQKAIDSVDPTRFNQEPTYTAALLSKLEGVAYKGEHGEVKISSTVIDDRGRGSAESIFGADHAITATITDGTTTIRKAILSQAKLGSISEQSASELDTLKEQIDKMKKIVDAPKVMEIPSVNRRRVPAMVSGTNLRADLPYKPMPLPDYFVARIVNGNYFSPLTTIRNRHGIGGRGCRGAQLPTGLFRV